jgi:hypothetical protein
MAIEEALLGRLLTISERNPVQLSEGTKFEIC